MVQTVRIILRSLTYDQLVKHVQNDNSLEAELNLGKTSREILPDLKEALAQTILPNVSDKIRTIYSH